MYIDEKINAYAIKISRKYSDIHDQKKTNGVQPNSNYFIKRVFFIIIMDISLTSRNFLSSFIIIEKVAPTDVFLTSFTYLNICSKIIAQKLLDRKVKNLIHIIIVEFG